MEDVLSTPDENLRDRDHAINFLKNIDPSDYGDGEDTELLAEDEINKTINQLQGFDLHGMLIDSISDTELVDYEMVNYVLTRLPRMPGIVDYLKEHILDLVIDNAELLYPSSEQVVKFIASFDDLPKTEKKKIAKKLLKPLKSKKNPPPTYYAMWVLHIFSLSEDWNQISEIIHL